MVQKIEKLCECCGIRPARSTRAKYCATCGVNASTISRAKKKGLEVSQLSFTGNKLCECCHKRPVQYGRRKYCDTCAIRFRSAMARARAKGLKIGEVDFEHLPMCQCCGERPTTKWYAKYCDECAKHRHKIRKAKLANIDLTTLDFSQKMCEWCGERPVAKFKSKYCEVCSEHYDEIKSARKLNKDKSELDFSKPKLCQCCEKEPVATGNKKYCRKCGKHVFIIWRKLHDGGNVKDLWFVTERFCERCGTKLVSNQLKYCPECAEERRKHKYAVARGNDLDRLDRGEELSTCKICGKRPRAIGQASCLECRREKAREAKAKKKGLDHWTPAIKQPPKTLCSHCGKRPRIVTETRTLFLCLECSREYRAIKRATRKAPWEIKPVENPEAYYTPASGNLNCPICNAEYCIPGIPVGRYCRDKILNYIRCYKIWRRILELKGIRVPDVNEILPKGRQLRGYCQKCKIKPVTGNAVFCDDCAKEMQELRAKELKEWMESRKMEKVLG